jgi:3-hydroxyisobutyrate dehydrogenase
MIHPDSLALPGIETDIWNLLTAGSKNPKEAFYTGTLGTRSPGGVKLRTVVIREVNTQERQIICYSDKRAAKVPEIQINPSISFLFWDAEKRIQLRISGTAIVDMNNEIADKHWQQTTPSNRRSYMAIPAPGTLLDYPASGLSPDLDAREPTLEESEQSKVNFAVIVSNVHEIDFLHLGSKGHRRAIFRYEKALLKESSWMVP